MEEIIPWYKMPIELRSLPFVDRPRALASYEQIFGEYDLEKNIKTEEE